MVLQHFLGKEKVHVFLTISGVQAMSTVGWGDRRFGVPVRIQYAAALNRGVS